MEYKFDNKNKKIYENRIQPVLTYGLEVWVINKNMVQKFLSAEITYWIRCCGLTLQDNGKPI